MSTLLPISHRDVSMRWPLSAAGVGGLCGLLIAGTGELGIPVVVAIAVLGAVGAISWANPVGTMVAAVATIPLAALTASVGGAFNVTVSKALFLAAAAAWVARRAADGKPLIPSTPITAPLALLVVALLPGVFIGATPSGAAKQLVLWGGFAICALALAEDGDRRTVRHLLIALAVAGAGSAVYAIVQGGGSANQEVLDGGNFVSDRVSGPFGQTNTLATLLAMCLPAQLILASRTVGWRRGVYLAAAAASTLAMALTLSRGAFIGLAFAGVALVFYAPTRRILAVAAVALVLALLISPGQVGGALQLDSLVARVQSISDPAGESATLRTTLYDAVPQMVADRPFFGFGAHGFPLVASDYGLVGPTFTGEFGNPHNIFVGLLLDLGLLGLAAVAWLAIATVMQLRVSLSRREDGDAFAFALAIGAVLAATAIIGLFHDYLPGDTVTGPVLMLCGAGVALAGSARRA